MDPRLIATFVLLSLAGMQMMVSATFNREFVTSESDEGSAQGYMLFYSGMEELNPTLPSVKDPDQFKNSLQEGSGQSVFEEIKDNKNLNSTTTNGTSFEDTNLNGKTYNNITDSINNTENDTGSGDSSEDIIPPAKTTVGGVSPPTNNTTTSISLFSTTSPVTPSSDSTLAVAPKEALDNRGNALSPDGSDASGRSGTSLVWSGNSKAWAAVIGTALVVAFLTLVIFLLLKRRSHKDFFHSKLVEDIPRQPVLRLDNCEPLAMDSMTFSNPAFHCDSIQMDPFRTGGRHQRQY